MRWLGHVMRMPQGHHLERGREVDIIPPGKKTITYEKEEMGYSWGQAQQFVAKDRGRWQLLVEINCDIEDK